MGDLGVGALPTAHPTSTSTGTTGSTARSALAPLGDKVAIETAARRPKYFTIHTRGDPRVTRYVATRTRRERLPYRPHLPSRLSAERST